MERTVRNKKELETVKNVKKGYKMDRNLGPADAIFVADLHLTDTVPVSRKDDYFSSQKSKLRFLRRVQRSNNNCPVLCSGDVFDYWKASPLLCNMAYNFLPRPFYTIPGQHDLPMHSIEQFEKSALSLLSSVDDDITVLMYGNREISFNKFDVIGLPFGVDLDNFKPDIEHNRKRKILMIHQLIWPGAKPPWGTNNWNAEELLKKFDGVFDIILTGDNHGTFTVKGKNCIIVNPGSMLRANADQSNYKPAFYLYYTKTNELIRIEYPIQDNVHEFSYIYGRKEKEERISAYIERMKKDWDIGMSFENNLQSFFDTNKTAEKIRGIIWEHLAMRKI